MVKRFDLSRFAKLDKEGKLFLNRMDEFYKLINRIDHDIIRRKTKDGFIYEFWLLDSKGKRGMTIPICEIEVINNVIIGFDENDMMNTYYIYGVYVAKDMKFIRWKLAYDYMFKVDELSKVKKHKLKKTDVIEQRDKFGHSIKMDVVEFKLRAYKLGLIQKYRNLKNFKKNKCLMYQVINKKIEERRIMLLQQKKRSHAPKKQKPQGNIINKLPLRIQNNLENSGLTNDEKITIAKQIIKDTELNSKWNNFEDN